MSLLTWLATSGLQFIYDAMLSDQLVDVVSVDLIIRPSDSQLGHPRFFSQFTDWDKIDLVNSVSRACVTVTAILLNRCERWSY